VWARPLLHCGVIDFVGFGDVDRSTNFSRDLVGRDYERRLQVIRGRFWVTGGEHRGRAGGEGGRHRGAVAAEQIVADAGTRVGEVDG
jgi:hypothetical protein